MALTSHPDAASLYAQMREDRAENLAKLAGAPAPAAALCDDCAHGCRDACAFISADEQPYFQAYRLAKRIPPGEPWDAWDYMAWNAASWRAFCAERGVPESQRLLHAEAFQAWLFRSVGHPAAPATEEA